MHLYEVTFSTVSYETVTAMALANNNSEAMAIVEKRYKTEWNQFVMLSSVFIGEGVRVVSTSKFRKAKKS